MSQNPSTSSTYHINMEILKCIEENELNQMIEDASNCMADLNEGNVKFDVVQNAYKDATKDLAKSLWSSIELAFVTYAKDKCDIFVPKERVHEFRRIAFPRKEFQGINLMLTRLEEFYLHQSGQSANEFDHFFDMTKQMVRNIKSMPAPEQDTLDQLRCRFRQLNRANDENDDGDLYD